MEDVIIRLQAIRRERAIAIGARLERLGMHGAYECACALAGHAQPGRVHFARFLQTSGVVGNIGIAFDRLLKRGKPAYVAASWPAMNEAVSAIRAARGVAVLAHPLRYQLTATWRRRIAGAFREMGGAAIEVVSGMQTAEQTAVAADLAERTRLHASIGSDFHSPEARWSAFGRLPSLPPHLAPVMELLDAQGMSGC
jgi:predicted metal-dependent phosphoesterase TrpH